MPLLHGLMLSAGHALLYSRIGLPQFKYQQSIQKVLSKQSYIGKFWTTMIFVFQQFPIIKETTNIFGCVPTF